MRASLLFALLALHQTASDDRAQWLTDHAVAVQSIDPADEQDFSDLQPLKQLIGDSRLVVLGEQSHGDGAAFYAKARLIKFLHKEMGFDVLAWESGMFDCREVDRAVKDPGVPVDEAFLRGVFAIWTRSAQVQPTMQYVRQTQTTDRPIETCGFDHQFSSGMQTRWPMAMMAYFDAADPTLLPAEIRGVLLSDFKNLFQRDAEKTRPLVDQLQKIGELMDQHRSELEKASSPGEFAFMRRTADDAVVSAKSMLEFLEGQGKPIAKMNNTRDLRMGENLIWLVNERYKDRKIIVWMASFHAVHDVANITPDMNPKMYAETVNCGTVAHRELKDKMYTIGFTAYDGIAGNVWGKSITDIPRPAPGSLEDLCHQTGKPLLFVDFKSLPTDHWLRGDVVSRPLGYGEMKTHWPDQMDAMFYIQTMFPSTKEDMLPPYARLRADQK